MSDAPDDDRGENADHPDHPNDADDAADRARARARRRAEVFGDVLPESTRDDRDPSAPRAGDPSEEWLKSNVPPHHG